MNHRIAKPLSRCWAILAGASIAFSLNSRHASAQQAGGNLDVRPSRVTGLASLVTARGGGPMIVQRAAGRLPVDPMDFWAEHGGLFGVADPARQLRLTKSEGDAIGHSHFTYEQVHDGIVVFSGVLKAHRDPAGNIVAANGDFYPIPAGFKTKPAIDSTAAAGIALKLFDGVGGAIVQQVDLVIVDPAWYGDPPVGVHLAWYLVVTDAQAGVAEALFVDAHTGKVFDRWSLIHNARVREIHDAAGTPSLPGPPARIENDPPVGDFDVDAAYDYYGDTYDYFFRAFARDGIDDHGMTMIATVDSTAPNCPNAYWNGAQMVFCAGMVTDDVVGHELTHGVMEYTAELIYQNQSGQLNESFSDVFGELIDLFNGNASLAGPPGGTPWPLHPPTGPGTDTPNGLRTTSCSRAPGYADGFRWLIGEDAIFGAIRDMWDPTCFEDPDYANSKYQTCDPDDYGGVHSGSGIPNHAFAMLVDGKTFNGRTISSIGPIKAGAVWYRTLTFYLTPASDFNDAYAFFNQAAADLVGTFPNDPRTGAPSGSMFTAADAVEVNDALLAVEMNTFGRCGGNDLDGDPPPYCSTRTTIYSNNFEGSVTGWTAANSSPPTPYDWVLASGLPHGRPGTAAFCEDRPIGICGGAPDEEGVHVLFSPVIVLPSPLINPGLAFTHYMNVESGFDGGNVWVRINGGAWQPVLATAFDYNVYNATLFGEGNTNQMAGEDAWSHDTEQWGTSVVDLSGYDLTGGETLEVRFDFGKNSCIGVDGWYVDDFEVFQCPPCAEEQKLTASDAEAGAEFGWTVSVSGNTAVFGARSDNHAGNQSGSAYVFVRTGGVWTQQQKLTASDAAMGDYFGYSVSVNGDTAVVGAGTDDGVGVNSGSAYVFVRSGGVWTQQQKLTASDAAANDWFGWPVSVSGDTVVVGAYRDDGVGTDSGSAYVFVRSGGVWTQQQKLTASDAAAQDQFGSDLSVSGDTAVVSARWDDGAGTDSGSAYVFVRSGGVWTQQQKLTASDAATNDWFGFAVSVSGNKAVVGAPLDDDAGSSSGSAYVFVRSGGVWTQQQKLTASDAAANDQFGQLVSLTGDTVAIGTPADDAAGPFSGSAYLFSCSPPPSLVTINEVDYDQPGTDFDEFIELHGPGGMGLTGWTVELVDGASGLVYTTIPLTSIPANGYLVIDGGTFAAAGDLFAGGSDNIQNGPADGIALCDNGVLVDMISYEGVTMATSGCASGMAMPNVGADDGNNVGESMARAGNGSFVLQPSTPGDDNGVPICSPPDCNGHGTCDDETCICDTGYVGAGCNQCAPDYYHYPICTFCLAATTCSGHGTCNSLGACDCNTGFAGPACDQCGPDYYNYPTCTFCLAATTCSGHGTCNALGACDCNVGFVGAACDQCGTDYYDYPTCTFCLATTTCSGHGVCNALGGCDCDTGFAGTACDQCAPGHGNYPICTESPDPPQVGDDTCQTAGADTGIPCATDADCTPPAACGNKSRYISVTPTNAAVAGAPTSIQVEIVSLPQFPARVGEIWWAGVEQNVPNSPNPSLRGAPLVCSATPTNAQVWTSGVLHLFGTAVVPGSTYHVRMCDAGGSNCSAPLLVATGKWGDVIRGFGGGSQPNFGDINSIVQKFGNLATAPSMPRADLVGVGNPGTPNTPNQVANFADVSNDVAAFGGFPYPFTVPTCP